MWPPTPNDKKLPAYRDWIAIIIATISFLISVAGFAFSAISTYYGVIAQSEEFRVVLGQGPGVVFDDEKKELTLAGDISLVFTNAGNRSVVVMGLSIFVDQEFPPNPLKLVRCSGVEIPVTANQIVVREKEILPIRYTLAQEGWYEPRGQDSETVRAINGVYRISFSDANLKRKRPIAATCLRIYVGTPSITRAAKDIAYYQFEESDSGMYIDTYTPDAPITVLRHRATVFGE
jgi:hypothetical protein